jgi:hypothetical protein
MRHLLVCTIALCACGDDQSPVAVPPAVPDAAILPSADAGLADAEVESKAIALIDWVDDLIDHHTDDSSAPDTVHDKNIADDEDPSHFERRF